MPVKAEWSHRSVRIPETVTEVIQAAKTESVICEDRGRNYWLNRNRNNRKMLLLTQVVSIKLKLMQKNSAVRSVQSPVRYSYTV